MIKKLLVLGIFSLALSLSAQIQGTGTLVMDINAGDANSLPANLFTFGGHVYFQANDAGTTNPNAPTAIGIELWRTNGTTTELVKDINTEQNFSSRVTNFFELNGNLYFSALEHSDASTSTRDLYTSDGTEVGTVEIDLISGNTQDEPSQAFVDGSIAYLYAKDASDASRLIEFNGTTANEVANADTDTSAKFTPNVTNGIGKIGSKLIISGTYTTATDPNGVVSELYAYDTATDLFTLIKDIDNDPTAASSPKNLTTLGSKVYFSPGNGTTAKGRLWETGGTEALTGQIVYSNFLTTDIAKITSLYAWNGKLFFEGDDEGTTPGITSGAQLFVYDPSDGSLTDLSQQGADHDPKDFVPGPDGYLYYAGETPGSSSHSLYRTDGTSIEYLFSDGTANGVTINAVDDLAVLGTVIYFEGEDLTDDPDVGRELFAFDTATLSTSTIGFSGKIAIHPNPTIDVINVSHDLNTKLNYEIFDVMGRDVMKGELRNKTINHNLNPGIYVLRLSNQTDRFTQKIVVE
ncbi:T9SS type A sorting domain-containing protein [Flavivirga abyssicola]|uniref:T9SS type A sorting domain-containing protein n=1 Tax=Flavivirga abyssicola TaxID=3063533 RepID=UPI0026DF0442|nr:T9SS type A sorting domain-containing protein [Flavivirga sp. MEBiC07777]WVK12742.1 T9SS type A sorting domain-containing protein [Flavivirga sp. MEBiC07777]